MLGLMLGMGGCAAPQGGGYTPSVKITPGQQARIYTGDTLYSFARRNKVSMRELIDLNRLQAPFELTPGSTLTLPADAGPLPSVELGPAGYSNEAQYKNEHNGKGVTTYTQIVPEPLSPAPVAAKDAPTQLLNEQPALQPQKPSPSPTKPAVKTGLAETLNLQPLHYDKQKKQLKAPANAAKPLDSEVAKIIKKKTAELQEKPKPEPKQDVDTPKTETEKPQPEKQPALHSRIEKKEEPINFVWPVQGPVISTFGPKSNGLSNDGINIAAPRSTPVLAADGGTVAYAGSDIPGFGNVVLLRHASGLMTTYAHLERMFVQRDVVVAKGDLIGTVGTSGGVDTPQLHFEIRREKEALDPSKYLYK